MKFHYHLLINPASGSGNGGKIASSIIDLLLKNHFLYTTYFTQYPGEESEIAEKLALEILRPWEETSTEDFEEPYPLLLVLGGDGTLHGVLNQFYQMHLEIPVGYLPAGSGNDLARAIGLPKETELAFWQIVKAQHPREINVITYEEKIEERTGLVFNNFGIGLDASVVAATNDSTTKKNLNKYRLGSLSYIVSIIKVLFTQKGFPILIEINGQESSFKKAFLCTTTNHPYFGGGIPIAPMAGVEEDSLDLVIVERLALFKIFWLILLLLRKKHPSSQYFHHFSAKKLRLVSTIPQFAQTDGEVLEKQSFDLYFGIAKQQIWY